MKYLRFLSFGIVGLFLFSACEGIPLNGEIRQLFFPGGATSTLSPSPFLPYPGASPTSTPAPNPSPIPTSAPITEPIGAVWVSSALPAAFRIGFIPPEGWTTTDRYDAAGIRVEVGGEQQVAKWIYALVAPFPTVVDGTSGDELRRAWAGEAVGPFAGRPLLLDQNTQDVLTAFLGAPGANAIAVLPADQLVKTAFAGRPSWAVVPFESIESRWKVLAVDGISPLQKEFNADQYLLTVPISLSGEPGLREKAAAEFLFPSTNRDPAKLTTLLLTGVTAMVRATAWLMEKKGVLYPAQDIGPLLRAADLTHISNEVPFAQDCPFPDPNPGIYRFCSDSRYIDLMEDIGTDIVELTGNHFQDWGSEATLYTLELYRQRGWKTYGGGANLEDAKKSITVEHNGNRLAFIGCNIHGPDFAWATPSLPGSAPCDFEFLRSEIRRLRDAGYLPIMTYQYHEYEYYEPTVPQMQDFRDVADAGAIIVSGSQGHHPQGFEFRNRSFLHYGLGNLFFDQYLLSEENREAFIDRHVFYDGRYLGAELITIVFVDNARPRLMEPWERALFLEKVFSSTPWSVIE